MGQHRAAPLASYSTGTKRSVEKIFILMAIQSVDKSVWIFHSNENTKCTIQSVGKCTGNFSLVTIQSVEKSVGISFWWQVNDLAVMTPDMVDGHQTPDLDDLVDNLRRPHNLRWQKVVQCVRGLSWHKPWKLTQVTWDQRGGLSWADFGSQLKFKMMQCIQFTSTSSRAWKGYYKNTCQMLQIWLILLYHILWGGGEWESRQVAIVQLLGLNLILSSFTHCAYSASILPPECHPQVLPFHVLFHIPFHILCSCSVSTRSYLHPLCLHPATGMPPTTTSTSFPAGDRIGSMIASIVGECISCAADTHLAMDLTC